MQFSLYNLKRWSPFFVLIGITLFVLLRMFVHGSASKYQTESTDATLIYREACSSCHGLNGLGVHFYIPDLVDVSLTADEVKDKISSGGLFMPAFGRLKEAQIDNLSQYVVNKIFK